MAPVAFAAAAPDDDDPVAKITAIRTKANERAEAVFALESEIDRLELEASRLDDRVANMQREIARLDRAADAMAVDSFVGGADSGLSLLVDPRAPTRRLTETFLTEVADGRARIDLDDYQVQLDNLSRARAEVANVREEIAARRSELVAALDAAFDEVEALRRAEERYLTRRATREAVREGWAAEHRADDARDRNRALERERSLAPAALEPSSDTVARSASSAESSSAVRPVDSTAPEVSQPPRVDVNGNVFGGRTATGGAVAGRTGLGGIGSDAEAPPPPPPPPSGVWCPVAGPSSYADTWGAPRSGGRRHQGVDMLALSGTPLQAVVPGTVTHGTNSLGGTVVTLFGDDGNRYYYAHLSRYEGPPRRVGATEVIGYVGDTGNATGVPHLHFEVHPGGGVAINPYPWVVASGC